MSQSPRSVFRTDVPPDRLDAETDAFGHRDYAEALAGALQDAPVPFTVAIFGPWGAGKSSIIREVRNRLRGGVAFAYYDAWRYEGDALRRQFLRDVAQQLEQDNQLKGFTTERDLKDLEVTVQAAAEKFYWSWRRFLLSVASSAVLAIVVWVLLRTALGHRIFSGGGETADAAAGVLVFIAGTVLTFVRDPLQLAQPVTVTHRLEESDRFTAKFEQMMAALRAGRLVIAIDNLDRCSPERAVEVLSTIKTYLEPALEPVAERRWLPSRLRSSQVAKEAVFLVAADLEALQRHLTTSEMARSELVSPEDARRDVDEYLRKFFNASISVRSSLDTEIRTYVDTQLNDLAVTENLSTDDRRVMIEMVTAALGTNPRRVKQFANNLELRLRLIRAREVSSSGHPAMISPRISDRPLAVAKLALIEDEWPEAFSALLAYPRALEQWEFAARNITEAVDVEYLPEAMKANAERWLTLAAFLRSSDAVRIPEPRPFLRLKQSQREVALPGYPEFVEHIRRADRDAVERLLTDQAAEQRSALLDELPNLLQQELQEGWLLGAVAVVDIALSLEIAEQVRAIVLHRAIAHPSFRPSLSRLDARRLLRVGRSLSSQDLNDVQVLLADALVRADVPELEQSQIASALADESSLTAPTRERIQRSFDQALGHRHDVAAILVDADPSLVNLAILNRAIQTFPPVSPGTVNENLPVFSQNQSSLRLALAGIETLGDHHASQTLLNYAIALANSLRTDPRALQAEAPYISKVLVVAGLNDHNSLATFIEESVATLSGVPATSRASWLQVMAAALGNLDESLAPQIIEQAMNLLFQDADVALGIINSDQLPRPFWRDASRLAVNFVTSDDQAMRNHAAEALRRMGTQDEVAPSITTAAERAVHDSHYERVTELLEGFPDELAAHAGQLASTAVRALPDVVTSQHIPAFPLIHQLRHSLAEDDLDRYFGWLRAGIGSTDLLVRETSSTLLAELMSEPEFSVLAARTISRIASELLATPHQPFDSGQLLIVLLSHLDLLSEDVRGDVIRYVVELIGLPELAERVTTTLQTGAIDSLPRTELVRALVLASHAGLVESKLSLLAAARAIAADADDDLIMERLTDAASSANIDDLHVAAAFGFGSLEVASAVYAGNVARNDVTEIVRGLIHDGQLHFVATNDVLGGDPEVGTPKTLEVSYRLTPGAAFIGQVFQENSPVDLP